MNYYGDVVTMMNTHYPHRALSKTGKTVVTVIGSLLIGAICLSIVIGLLYSLYCRCQKFFRGRRSQTEQVS